MASNDEVLANLVRSGRDGLSRRKIPPFANVRMRHSHPRNSQCHYFRLS